MLASRRRPAAEPTGHDDGTLDTGTGDAAPTGPPTDADGPLDPSRPRPGIRDRRTRVLVALGALLLTLLFSVVVNLLLDASAWPQSLTALRTRSFDNASLVPSVAVVWLVVLLVVALLGRVWLALGVVSALTVALGLINLTKLELRSDPLYPGDVVFLSQPSFLVEMASPARLTVGAVALVGVVVTAGLVGWLIGRVFPQLTMSAAGRRRPRVLMARLVVAALCLGLLHVASDFNERGNVWRAAFDATGLRWRSWDQRVNYQQNGFVPGFLFNTRVDPMTRPADYSRVAVERIAERYRADAAQMNQGRAGSLEDTNVVVVLSESFSQPAWLDDVTFPVDLIPRTTETMSQTLSGKMLAPGVGSGTANTEFELLTGQSLSQLSPQLTSPYEQLVSRYDAFPSMVDWFGDRGHETLAIHPFSPRMYSRPTVYEAFGFDRFLAKEQLTYRGRGGGRFIDDRSAFQEVLRGIRTTEEPLLAHLVTMQNHMPYEGQYDDPILPTDGLSEPYAELAGFYARGINRTDEALAEMLAELRRTPEPTTVIFYGDHLPPQVYPQSLMTEAGARTSHETPFLIWNNQKALEHTDLPTTSPTQFLPLMFNAMDVPVPPWLALLSEVGQQVPAMDAGIVIDADDQQVRRADLDGEAKAVLADYRMIQYDLSVGERWSEDVMFGDAPTG